MTEVKSTPAVTPAEAGALNRFTDQLVDDAEEIRDEQVAEQAKSPNADTMTKVGTGQRMGLGIGSQGSATGIANALRIGPVEGEILVSQYGNALDARLTVTKVDEGKLGSVNLKATYGLTAQLDNTTPGSDLASLGGTLSLAATFANGAVLKARANGVFLGDSNDSSMSLAFIGPWGAGIKPELSAALGLGGQYRLGAAIVCKDSNSPKTGNEVRVGLYSSSTSPIGMEMSYTFKPLTGVASNNVATIRLAVGADGVALGCAIPIPKR